MSLILRHRWRVSYIKLGDVWLSSFEHPVPRFAPLYYEEKGAEDINKKLVRLTPEKKHKCEEITEQSDKMALGLTVSARYSAGFW